MLNYLLNRLKEASTWRGLVGIATAAGVAIEPEQMEAIIAAGLALAGLVAVFTKDTGAKD